MGPTDPAATRPSRYWFCSVGHSLRPTGAARCREHRGRPWKASLRAPFHSRSPKPEFAARIPSTPHLGSTHHFKRFGVLILNDRLYPSLGNVQSASLAKIANAPSQATHHHYALCAIQPTCPLVFHNRSQLSALFLVRNF